MIKTTPEDLKKAAQLADELYKLREQTGIISVLMIDKPRILLTPAVWKETFAGHDGVVIANRDGNRFYDYDDGHTLWQTNEAIKEAIENEGTD